MKIAIAIALFALSVGVAGSSVHAASPHTIILTPRSLAPGKTINLSGQTFVSVRAPFRDLGSTARFSITFLAPKFNGFLNATVSTLHSKDPLIKPIDIDGFDATVTVADGHTYTVATDFANPGNHTFTASAYATCVVSIKVLQTLVTVTAVMNGLLQPATGTGAIPNALPVADWADYVHPTVQVAACDKWAEHIRIQQQ